MNRKREKAPAFDRYKKFGVFITDENGVAVRCFDARPKAFNWIKKHWPGLNESGARRRVRTFGSYKQVRQFFDDQIQKGCADAEVLTLMTYYCGVSTKRGLDLENGHTFKISNPKGG